MKCMACGAPGSGVYDTRTRAAYIERVRMCVCGARWESVERPRKGTLVMKAPAISTPRQKPLVPAPSPAGSQPVPFALSSPIPSLSSPSQREADISKQTPALKVNTMSRSVARRDARQDPSGGAAAAFTAAMGLFCEAWKTRYGISYTPTAGDCGQLKALVTRASAETQAQLPRAFENYMADEDVFVAQKMRHSLTHFCTGPGLNKYLTETPIYSDKEARGRAAEDQWLRLRRGGVR